MISDTNEKTEAPPPLTQREMNQFVTLAALPTLERALARLRWLEAEVAALKAQRDEAFKSAINAALRADDHNADPLAEMWRELSEYQPMADADGYGEAWAKMCSERTQDAAMRASAAACNAGGIKAREATHLADSFAFSARPWAAGKAALRAAWAIESALSASRSSVRSIDALRRAKEAKP